MPLPIKVISGLVVLTIAYSFAVKVFWIGVFVGAVYLSVKGYVRLSQNNSSD